ncbi:MAG: hypothetical protein ACTHNW_04930 [Mucilaginibacter sp.]
MTIPKYLKNLDSFIAAILGFIAVHIYTKYSGVGISPDSIMYASTARNIYEHGTLITFNGGPLVFFPVFYPFFLSICMFITGGASTFSAAPVINGILFGAVIFFTGYTISKFDTKSVVYKWLILIALIVSPALLEIYTYLWSETLFILEVVLFPIIYRQYLLKRTTKSLLWVCLLTAVACITRYIGVTLIMAGGMMLLLDKELPIRRKIYHILLFGFSSITLLVLNLIKNRLSSGLSTGTREPSITPLSKNLFYTGSTYSDWMGLPDSMHQYGIAIACLIIFALVAILVWRFSKDKLNRPEGIITMFALVYAVFLPVLATFSRFEPLNSRLMSPVFVSMLIGITCWVPDALKGVKLNKQLAFAIPFVALMLLFEYSTASVDYQRYDDENDYGVPGYSDDDWNGKPFITFLKTHPNIYQPGVPKFTDADEAVYFFTGGTAKLLPHRYFTNTVDQFFKVKHYYLIWFNALDNPELIGIKDIQQRENLKLLYKFPEGSIYEYKGQ